MRRSILAAVVAAALVAGWAPPAVAQDSGIIIQNNGVDSSDSAAGADNVRISNNPGNGQSLSGGGLNNEIGTGRERKRKDRDARNNAEAAPAEEYVAPVEAPVEGDYQAYGEEYVEPVPAVDAAVAAPASQAIVKLPSTGSGSAGVMPLAAAAGILAVAFAATGFRRRQTT